MLYAIEAKQKSHVPIGRKSGQTSLLVVTTIVRYQPFDYKRTTI